MFGELTRAIDNAIGAAGPDLASVVAAINRLDGVDAAIAGGDVSISIGKTETVALLDEAFSTGAGGAGIGLTLGGTFASTLSATLTARLRIDADTGEVWIETPAGTREVDLTLESRLSLAGDADLGFIDISLQDADAAAPEISLSTSLDLATGRASAALARPFEPKFTGTAALDLDLTTEVLGGALPTIRSNLVMDYDLVTGEAAIAFNDITIDIAGLFGIVREVCAEIEEKLDTFPLGVILDLATDALPIIQGLAEKFKLVDPLDKVPSLIGGDGKVSLADLAVLYNQAQGGGVDTYFQAIGLIGFLKTLAGSIAEGTISLGDVVVAGNPRDTAAAARLATLDAARGFADALTVFNTALRAADADNDTGTLLDDPSKIGLRLPILEDPSLIMKLLLNDVFDEDVTLVQYELPDLDYDFVDRSIDIPLLGPIVLTFTGNADVKVDLDVGYDTNALRADQKVDIADGLFFTNLDAAGNPGNDRVGFMQGRLGAGAALNAVVLRVETTGGIYFNAEAALDYVNDPYKLRLDEAGDCFFDVKGKLGADVRVRVKIDVGLFSYSKSIPVASVVLADFSLGCEAPGFPVDKGLARIRTGAELLLHTGPEAGNRLLNRTTGEDVGEGYSIGYAVDPETGATLPGVLAVRAFGTTQSFAGVAKITGNLGNFDDSLMVAAGVTNAVDVYGGAGHDLITGGRLGDTLRGDGGNDYLVGNDGDDLLEGGADDDTFVGGAGADTIVGGAGVDEVSYAEAKDTLGVGLGVVFALIPGEAFTWGLTGEAAGDRLSGIDHITGSEFKDTIYADAERVGDGFAQRVLEGLGGRDYLIGNAGGDLLIGGAGADFLLGNGGVDTVSYLTSRGGVVVNLLTRRGLGADAEGDWIEDVEHLHGSGFKDVLTGDGAANSLYGFFDNDVLSGGGGADKVFGDEGDDTVFGGLDGDTLDGGGVAGAPGEDMLSYRFAASTVQVNLQDGIAFAQGGAPGTDTLVSRVVGTNVFSSFENIEGSNVISPVWRDVLIGDDGHNIIWGLAGNDLLRGGNGFDRLIGGQGADQLEGGAGIDWAEYRDSAEGVTVYLAGWTGVGGTAAGDVISGVENLLGSDQSDDLYGDIGNNTIDPGLAGANRFDDLVDGGLGLDTLRLDYSREDKGRGLQGGFTTGSPSAGFFARPTAGTDLLDAVTFRNVERLEITATRSEDYIVGGGSGDVIWTGDGGDIVFAGVGRDRIETGNGDDYVAIGTALSLALSTTAGADQFLANGGRGIDTLSVSLAALSDNISLVGRTSEFTGTNYFNAATGAQIVNFEILANVRTGSGDDSLTQLGSFANEFYTGDGVDTIRPGLGFDLVDGGASVAALGLSPATVTRTIFSGEIEVGSETFLAWKVFDLNRFRTSEGDLLLLDYSGITAGAVRSETRAVSETLPDGLRFWGSGLNTTQGRYWTTDGTNSVSFTGIERVNVTGSRFDDVLVGADTNQVEVQTNFGPNRETTRVDIRRGHDFLSGGDGNDTFYGLGGNDTLVGGSGNDTLWGADTNTFFSTSTRDVSQIDVLEGGIGADTFALGDARALSYFQRFVIDESDGYARIVDFSLASGDRIQLTSTGRANYKIDSYANASGGGVAYVYYREAISASEFWNLQAVVDYTGTAPTLTNGALIYASATGFAPSSLAAGATLLLAAEPEVPAAPAPALLAGAPIAAQAPAAWVTRQGDVAALQAALGAGSGVVAGSGRLTIEGASDGFGTFSGDPFGLGSGIVLSTGRVEDLDGPNTTSGPSGSAGRTKTIAFTYIGTVGESGIYKADLSGLGIDIASLRLTDLHSRLGGAGGSRSGFDIDAVAFSTVDLASVTAFTNLNDAMVLPRIDAFDFAQSAIRFTPGTQRPPTAGSPYDYAANLDGTFNSYPGSGSAMIDAARLATFVQGAEFGSFALGDGGSVHFDLKQQVSSDGPLYLYVAEDSPSFFGSTGDALSGEMITGSVSGSSLGAASASDLSTDVGAPGLAGDTTRMTYSFTPVAGTDLVTFQVVLFSEEWPENAGVPDPDALTVTLNGVAIARLSDGAEASLNTLMLTPGVPLTGDLILNPVGTGALADRVAADGYTRTLTFLGRVTAGTTNTLVVEVADARDAHLDTGVLIKGGTFLASGGAVAANLAPFAVADVAAVAHNTAVTGNVLTNDVDPNGDTLRTTLVTGPANGTVSLGTNGSYTYTPRTGYFGTDSFTYRASDPAAASDVGVVNLLVGRPAGVSADGDGPYSTPEDTVLTVGAASGVLAGDESSTGGTLTAQLVTGTTRGTLALAADGAFTYQPGANFAGTDSFVYRAVLGTLRSAPVTVEITTTAVNDAPTLSLGAQSRVLVEKGVTPANAAVPGVATATIALVKGDPDTGNTTSYVTTEWTGLGGTKFSQTGTYGAAVLDTATGVLSYTLANARPQTDALVQGAAVTDSFIIAVKDPSGATVTRTATFAIQGTNDLPTLSVGAPSRPLIEAGSEGAGVATASLSLGRGDPDTGALPVFDTAGWTDSGAGKVSKAGLYGTAVLDRATGLLSYTLDNGRAATNALRDGATVSDSIAVTVRDAFGASTTRSAAFEVRGADDPLTLTLSAPSARLVEAGAATPGVPSATITATRSDPDTGDTAVFDTTGWTAAGSGRVIRAGVYGTAVLDTATGRLTYTLDNARAATDDLETGDLRSESFALRVAGAGGAARTQTAVFTIAGTGDGVTINGTSGQDVISATSTVPRQPLPTRHADTILGNAGDDRIAGLGGKDTIDGGTGTDTADYAEKVTAVAVVLNGAAAATVTVGGQAEDTIRNIENLTGGSGDDRLTGDGLANLFAGRAGRDVIDGAGGRDTASYAEKTAAISVTLNGATSVAVKVGTAIEDTIRNIEDLVGGSGADTMTGDGLDNLFSGRGGKDALDGRGGIDTADYAEKTSSVTVTLDGATVAAVRIGNGTEDTLRNIENVVGGQAADRLTGDGLANALSGNAGNDTLKGAGGTDALDGGAGSDTADYSDKTAAVVLTLNGGTAATVSVGGVAEDTVRSIENVIGGSRADTLTGDALDNLFVGLGGADTINGGGGTDTASYAEKTAAVAVRLNGGNGATLTVGGLAEDQLRNIENLIGGTAADSLVGDASANLFAGRGGADSLDGAGGQDTADYAEKTVAVSVTLNGAVEASVRVGGLAEDRLRNIENLIGGTAADSFTGDSLDNRFSGRGGADVLDGAGGSDTAEYTEKTSALAVELAGGTFVDVRVGGTIEDRIRNIENVLGGSGEDTLTGDAAANLLSGNGGDDLLRGRGGKDVLDGGQGTDTADYGDKTAGVAAALKGGANASVAVGGLSEDTVRNIENLLGGSGNDTLTGDALANLLVGRAGNDSLAGGAGNDRLEGGFGNDWLEGGTGADVFVFAETAGGAADLDTIADFNVADDSIMLDSAIFAALGAGPAGLLPAEAFRIGTQALTADQHVLYDSLTGKLFYDADGLGGADAIQFAALSARPVLSAADFLVT